MSPSIAIATPENILVSYRTAGVASRFAAGMVDLALQLLLSLVVVYGVNLVSSALGFTGLGIDSIVTALGIVALFLVVFAYAIFFEMLMGGRTPGKKLLGLRVVRDGGLPITFVSSVVRNVLRFLDFGVIPISPPFVLFGLPGLLTIFFSSTGKRIGDYAAGTIVIVEAGGSPLSDSSDRAVVAPGVAALLPQITNSDRVTPDEYRVLRRFVAGRADMDLPSQASLGELLARPLLDRLDIRLTVMYQLQFADIIEAIERCYAEEHDLF